MALNPLALGYITSVLEALPLILTDSEEIVSWVSGEITTIRDMVASGQSPTADQWAALDQTITGLRAQLDAGSSSSTAQNTGETSSGSSAGSSGSTLSGGSAVLLTSTGPAAAPTGAAPFPSSGANEGA
jgi:hypothetical protein